jgi:hypothetical protein
MSKIDVTVFGLDDEFLNIRKQKPTKEDRQAAKKIDKDNEPRIAKVNDIIQSIDNSRHDRKKLQSRMYYYKKQLAKADNFERIGEVENKLELINSGLIQTFNDIRGNRVKAEGLQMLINESIEDKKQLLNKDFSYVIRDNFNKPYLLKAPKGTSDENNAAYILKNYIKAMKEALKITHYKSGKEVKQKTKDKIQFLIDNAQYNLDFVEDGYSEDEFESDTDYYPLKIHFVGREIEINF